MTPRNTRILLAFGAFCAGLVFCIGVVVLVSGRLSAPGVQQSAAIGGAFSLTDQDGVTVTDRDFLGRPFLVCSAFSLRLRSSSAS